MAAFTLLYFTNATLCAQLTRDPLAIAKFLATMKYNYSTVPFIAVVVDEL